MRARVCELWPDNLLFQTPYTLTLPARGERSPDRWPPREEDSHGRLLSHQACSGRPSPRSHLLFVNKYSTVVQKNKTVKQTRETVDSSPSAMAGLWCCQAEQTALPKKGVYSRHTTGCYRITTVICSTISFAKFFLFFYYFVRMEGTTRGTTSAQRVLSRQDRLDGQTKWIREFCHFWRQEGRTPWLVNEEQELTPQCTGTSFERL